MKLLAALLMILAPLSAFALESGRPAPAFELQGLKSKVSLSDFKGSIVVLEWLNHGCPFVRKHYDSGNMQKLQKKYVAKNVIWLSVISSAPGKQGHTDSEGALKEKKENKSAATDILLDPTGKVGMLYGAKTTPHMYVIDKEGVLVYQGAIDSKPDTDKESIKSARNFAAQALDEIMAGKKVTVPSAKAYGCSVKY